jgi:hypothetical protein
VGVGVDTTRYDTIFAVYLGSGYGQVFEARDTVLQAFSVWGECPNNTALASYILGLDSTGRPDIHRILRVGPTLTIQYQGCFPPPSPPADLPYARARFVFDPPVILPGPGSYEFVVVVAPDPPDYSCDGATTLLGDTLDPYPGGAAWRHVRTYPLCSLGGPRLDAAGEDLVFQLEFCEESTPVLRSSWGSLKVRYR